MSHLFGKTAKEILELVSTGAINKPTAIQHMINNGKSRVSKGRKPTFPSLKALAELTGKTIPTLRVEINALAEMSAPKESEPSKPKAQKPTGHNQLDALVAFVEDEVDRLMQTKTIAAQIGRMNKGMVKDQQKVANLREVERRLAAYQPEPEQKRVFTVEERMDNLENMLTKLMNKLG